MSLKSAIDQLQVEVDSFGQGTQAQPRENTPEWFLLRAKAIGLSVLKRMAQLDIERDPAACERLYRECSKEAKSG